MDMTIIDWGRANTAAGFTFVALNRARTLEGLRLRGWRVTSHIRDWLCTPRPWSCRKGWTTVCRRCLMRSSGSQCHRSAIRRRGNRNHWRCCTACNGGKRGNNSLGSIVMAMDQPSRAGRRRTMTSGGCSRLERSHLLSPATQDVKGGLHACLSLAEFEIGLLTLAQKPQDNCPVP